MYICDMFEQFLIDHGIYEEYMKEFKSFRNVTLAAFLHATPFNEYIISAFEWSTTDKGFNYWSLIHDKWVD